MTGEQREELRALLHTRSFQYGDFLLSSGRRSDFYFDGKQVTLDARGLHLVGLGVLERCRELEIEAVGGLTLGADPIAAAVAASAGATAAPRYGPSSSARRPSSTAPGGSSRVRR